METLKENSNNKMKKVTAINIDTFEKRYYNSVKELCEDFKDVYSSPCIRRHLSGLRVPSIQNSNWRFEYLK